jgi:hypothetical protein
MGFRERFGCFLLAVGLVTLLLFAFPIVQAFQRDPAHVPLKWIGTAALSILVLWAGWKLFASARRTAESRKPPSLGARLAARWREAGKQSGGEPPRDR